MRALATWSPNQLKFSKSAAFIKSYDPKHFSPNQTKPPKTKPKNEKIIISYHMDQLLFTEVCSEMAYLDFLGSGSLASLLPPCYLHSVRSAVSFFDTEVKFYQPVLQDQTDRDWSQPLARFEMNFEF